MIFFVCETKLGLIKQSIIMIGVEAKQHMGAGNMRIFLFLEESEVLRYTLSN